MTMVIRIPCARKTRQRKQPLRYDHPQSRDMKQIYPILSSILCKTGITNGK